jgi:hypothetical protein
MYGILRDSCAIDPETDVPVALARRSAASAEPAVGYVSQATLTFFREGIAVGSTILAKPLGDASIPLYGSSAEPAVAVKALEWREYPNEYYPDVFGHCWDADTPFGRYEISEASASDSPYYNVCFGTSFVADKDGLPEAEAAAQADYEQRVRSALASPPPSPQAFVLEMNKCVEQANENATRAEENAARAERLEKELQMLRCKVSASPPPSPVASEEMDAGTMASAIAAEAFRHMPRYEWGEQTMDEVHGAIQLAALKVLANPPMPALSHAPAGEAGSLR